MSVLGFSGFETGISTTTLAARSSVFGHRMIVALVSLVELAWLDKGRRVRRLLVATSPFALVALGQPLTALHEFWERAAAVHWGS